MTKSDLEKLVEYFEENTKQYRQECRTANPATLSIEYKYLLMCDPEVLLDILRQYPVTEDPEVNDPCTEEALYDKYISFKMAGFDSAQAFDLTREYYQDKLLKSPSN